MKKLFLSIFIFISTLLFSQNSTNVIVVYNVNSHYGLDISNYYKTARNIPEQNIFSISCDTAEVINESSFTTLFNDLKDSINVRDLQTGIKKHARFMVLCKGIPLKKVVNLDSACYDLPNRIKSKSVDYRLCFIFDESMPVNYYKEASVIMKNPYGYYKNWSYPDTLFGYKTFKSFKFHTDGDTMSYLVSRLDGYSLQDVYNIIDKSVNVVMNNNFPFTFDNCYCPGSERMERANDSILNLGGVVKYDSLDTPIIMIDSSIGYCSYGVHAPNYVTQYYESNDSLEIPLLSGYGPAFSGPPQFSNGALIMTMESLSGWSFYNEQPNCYGHYLSNSNHNFVADFIKYGATCGVGNVYEPYSNGISHPEILFSAYKRGYTFIESAYQSVRIYNSPLVVVGDPLCRISNNLYLSGYDCDVNGDGIVDLDDAVLVDNDAYNYVTGFVDTDLNGDQIVDGEDMSIMELNF